MPHGQQEPAEGALRVALAAGAEDRGHGVPARPGGRGGEVLEGGLDGRLNATRDAAERLVEGTGDHGGEDVVADGDGGAGGDEGGGVGLGEVDALAGLLSE